MKPWKPNAKQEQILRVIMSMTVDSMMGAGVDNPETYVSNLKGYVKMIEEGLKK